MKKISFKTLGDDLSGKLLDEKQMNALRGGLRCPFCGADMEVVTAGVSYYLCSGKERDINFNENDSPAEIIRAKTFGDACADYQIKHHQAYNISCSYTDEYSYVG